MDLAERRPLWGAQFKALKAKQRETQQAILQLRSDKVVVACWGSVFVCSNGGLCVCGLLVGEVLLCAFVLHVSVMPALCVVATQR